MPLKVFLYRLAINMCGRGKAVAAKEQRVHGGCGQLVCIGWPDHLRKRVAVGGMHDRRAGGSELRDIHADRLECPAWRAIATREATPNILVRVDQYLDAIVAGALDD